MGILQEASVEEFFYEMVSEAVGTCRLNLSAEAHYYLVGVLGDLARTKISDEPLCIRLADARNCDEPSEAIRELKEIGDTCLYMSGLFADSLERRHVKASFYMGIGRSAYGGLAKRLNRSSVGAVYREMTNVFPALVQVLASVRSHLNLESQEERIEGLLVEWKQTGSEDTATRLRSLGIVLPKNDECALAD